MSLVLSVVGDRYWEAEDKAQNMRALTRVVCVGAGQTICEDDLTTRRTNSTTHGSSFKFCHVLSDIRTRQPYTRRADVDRVLRGIVLREQIHAYYTTFYS